MTNQHNGILGDQTTKELFIFRKGK